MAKKPRVPKAFYSLNAVGRMLEVPADTIKEVYRGKDLSSIGAVSPIAHLFKRFEENGTFSYAILKKHFDRWQSTGKVPKVSPGRPRKWKDNPDIVFINKPVPKDLYEEFKEIVDNANKISVVKVTYTDMFAVAIKEFNDRRPQFKK